LIAYLTIFRVSLKTHSRCY